MVMPRKSDNNATNEGRAKPNCDLSLKSIEVLRGVGLVAVSPDCWSTAFADEAPRQRPARAVLDAWPAAHPLDTSSAHAARTFERSAINGYVALPSRSLWRDTAGAKLPPSAVTDPGSDLLRNPSGIAQ